MEGNTSDIDEEEFVEALKEEMPAVFTKINNNFKSVD
jgi:hypothetical protein